MLKVNTDQEIAKILGLEHLSLWQGHLSTCITDLNIIIQVIAGLRHDHVQPLHHVQDSSVQKRTAFPITWLYKGPLNCGVPVKR